jgi:putative peptidoglycan lipid II flippase
LIPRISGEFDAASFRAGPALARQRAAEPTEDSPEAPKTYLPEEDTPSTARGGRFKPQVPLPGRRTYQGDAGQNPYFPARGNHRK